VTVVRSRWLVLPAIVLAVGASAWVRTSMTSDGTRLVPCITLGLTPGQHPGECLVGAGAASTTLGPSAAASSPPTTTTATVTTPPPSASTVRVPLLLDKGERNAEQLVEAKGLKVLLVLVRVGLPVPAGTVISESPMAGAKVSEASTITIVAVAPPLGT